jgi:hypothetical protein
LWSILSPVKTASFKVIQRSGPTIQIPPETDRTATALCEPREVATGGGYTQDALMFVFESKALPDNTGWAVTFYNGGSNQPTLSQKVSYDVALNIINDWLTECGKVRQLDQNFDYMVRYALKYSAKNGHRPLKLDTLKIKNKKLYHLLQ